MSYTVKKLNFSIMTQFVPSNMGGFEKGACPQLGSNPKGCERSVPT